jgi:hypothetical protein
MSRRSGETAEAYRERMQRQHDEAMAIANEEREKREAAEDEALLEPLKRLLKDRLRINVTSRREHGGDKETLHVTVLFDSEVITSDSHYGF